MKRSLYCILILSCLSLFLMGCGESEPISVAPAEDTTEDSSEIRVFESDFGYSMEYDPSVFYVLGLYCHGELVTKRRVFFKDNFCKAVIDRNTYLGCTDHELEVEYTAGSEQKAQLLLDEVAYALMYVGTSSGIDAFYERIGSGKSKSERFFERKLHKEMSV